MSPLKELKPFLISLLVCMTLFVGTKVSAAPFLHFDRTILPETDSFYELGTSTQAWLRVFSDQFCLTGDTCISSWPSGGGGSGSVATSSNEVANQIPIFTSNSATPALIGGDPNLTYNPTDGTFKVGWGGNQYFLVDVVNSLYKLGDISGGANASTFIINDAAKTSTLNHNLIITGNSTTTHATSTTQAISSLTNALLKTDGNGTLSEYSGTSCTNQFVRSLDALGAATCATVSAGDVSLANLTATDSTLTFSGTYNGSAARTIGLNLAQGNIWTAASSTFVGGVTIGLSTTSQATTTALFSTRGTFDTVCLSSDVCRTTWPTGATPNSKWATSTSPTTAIYNAGSDRVFVGLTTGGLARLEVQGSTTAATDQAFAVWNSSGVAGPVITALNNGFVGIGTSTPPSRLTIATSTAYTAAFPGFLIGPSGISGGSANGTMIGANLNAGFSGRFIDFQVNGSRVFDVGSAGAILTAGNITSNADFILGNNSSAYRFGGGARSLISSSGNGLLEISNSTSNGFTRLNFGGVTASFPALARNLAGLEVRGGNGTATSSLAINTAATTTAFMVNGSVGCIPTSTATSYTISTSTDCVVRVTSTASARTITLPLCDSTTLGVRYGIKDSSGAAGTNNITVQRVAADTIDGATTKVINTNYGAFDFYCGATATWDVL